MGKKGGNGGSKNEGPKGKKGAESPRGTITLFNWLKKFRVLLPQQISGFMAVVYEKVATAGLGQFHHQTASEITSSLESGKLLDVGTGPGYLLAEIRRSNPGLELVGLDLSPKMLRIAKNNLAEQDAKTPIDSASEQDERAASSPAVQLVEGDVRDLPFPDGAFDFVVSTLSVHHWRSPAKGIRECLRVTAPGGSCWIYDLRTDVSPKAYIGLGRAKGLVGLLLRWVFKFHGLDPAQFEAPLVASWLGQGVTVQAEVHKAYLKLKIGKQVSGQKDTKTCSGDTLLTNSVALPA